MLTFTVRISMETSKPRIAVKRCTASLFKGLRFASLFHGIVSYYWEDNALCYHIPLLEQPHSSEILKMYYYLHHECSLEMSNGNSILKVTDELCLQQVA